MLIPVSYSFRSLFVRKTTTVATAFGIALVVFVLASAMMLAKGIKETLTSAGASDRAMVLRKGSDTELASSIDNPSIGIILSSTGVKKNGNTPLGSGEVVVVIAQEKLGTDGKISNVQVWLPRDFRFEVTNGDAFRASYGTGVFGPIDHQHHRDGLTRRQGALDQAGDLRR